MVNKLLKGICNFEVNQNCTHSPSIAINSELPLPLKKCNYLLHKITANVTNTRKNCNALLAVLGSIKHKKS